MQSNSLERQAGSHAWSAHPLPRWHVPALAPTIPAHIRIGTPESTLMSFAQSLTAAGLPVPSGTDSLHNMATGLQRWFDAALGPLQTFMLAAEIHEPGSARLLQQRLGMEGDRTEPFMLAITCRESDIRTMADRARALESVVPGLFQTAFKAVCQAQGLTLMLWDPLMLYETLCDWYWQGEGMGGIATDAEVEELLADVFDGSTRADWLDYLPSQVIPRLGGAWCQLPRNPDALLSNDALAQLTSHSSTDIAHVARATLTLKDSIASAREQGAIWPHLHDACVRPIWRGPVLLFEPHDYLIDFIDTVVNQDAECDEAVEYVGVISLPLTSHDLSQFFNQLQRGCTVLQRLDDLLCLISERIYS